MKLAAGIDVGADYVISAPPLWTKRGVGHILGQSVGHGIPYGLPKGLLVVTFLKNKNNGLPCGIPCGPPYDLLYIMAYPTFCLIHPTGIIVMFNFSLCEVYRKLSSGEQGFCTQILARRCRALNK